MVLDRCPGPQISSGSFACLQEDDEDEEEEEEEVPGFQSQASIYAEKKQKQEEHAAKDEIKAKLAQSVDSFPVEVETQKIEDIHETKAKSAQSVDSFSVEEEDHTSLPPPTLPQAWEPAKKRKKTKRLYKPMTEVKDKTNANAKFYLQISASSPHPASSSETKAKRK